MQPDTKTSRDKDGADEPGTLRRLAENRMGETAGRPVIPIKKEDMKKLIHELQVSRIEVEIQNEGLVQARDEVEALLERFTDLYDFAPVGHFTLDHRGTIHNVNLTGAALLGLERSLLVDRRFQAFVSQDSLPGFNAFLKTVFERKTKQFCDVEIRSRNDQPVVVRIEANVAGAGQECFMAVADITERKRAEEQLKHFNEELEKGIADRTAKLNASLEEKVVLLREIHHRVKNNLQIIISLLNLQSRYIEDERTQQLIRESQNRIRAMAHVHEKLYQSEDISKINLDDYVRFLGNSLFQFYGMKGKGITFTTDIKDISLDINTAIPAGLMINELISNSLKYAFPGGRKGEISIAIKRENNSLSILFADTGVGIPSDFDWRTAKSLGLRLVISLVEQLDGTIELDRTEGTAFTIVVKEKE
jgi:PAS domain S-box-containing protein